MSKKNGLGKLYDRITPEERFRLDVEAMARGDEAESERLVETCPRRTYTMTDIGFSGRWDGTREISMAVLLDLGQNVSKLRVVDAFRSVLPIARNLFYNEAATAYMRGREAGPSADKDLDELEGLIEEADILPRLLDRLERDLAAEALAVWRAFRGFCEEGIGVEAEKIISVTFPPALENIKYLEDTAARHELEPDPESTREYAEALAQVWRKAARL